MYVYVLVQLEDKVNVDSVISSYIYPKNIWPLYIQLSGHFLTAMEN